MWIEWRKELASSNKISSEKYIFANGKNDLRIPEKYKSKLCRFLNLKDVMAKICGFMLMVILYCGKPHQTCKSFQSPHYSST